MATRKPVGAKALAGKKRAAQPRRFLSGGAVDDSFDRPRVAALLPACVPPEEFCDWLQVELGRMRFMEDCRRAAPSRSVEIEALTAIQASLKAAVETMHLDAYPPIGAARVSEALYRATGRWLEDVHEAIGPQLYRLIAALDLALAAEAATPTKRGRKKESTRDAFFAGVIARLRSSGPTVAASQEVAAKVLEACGVDLPEDPRDRRRAADRAGEK